MGQAALRIEHVPLQTPDIMRIEDSDMSLLSNLKPGLTGLEQLRTLLAAGRKPSIHEALDIVLIAADEGAVAGSRHGAEMSDVGYRLRQHRDAIRTPRRPIAVPLLPLYAAFPYRKGAAGMMADRVATDSPVEMAASIRLARD